MNRTLKATTNFIPSTQDYCYLSWMALRKEFVKCRAFMLDGTIRDLVYGVDYNVNSSIVTFSPEILQQAHVGENMSIGLIQIYRQTPTDQLLTQYVDASVLKAYDMNVSSVQMLHILEEAYDYVNYYALLSDDETGTYNAKGVRISNLGTPVDDTDATTKKYVNDEDQAIKDYISRMCLLLDETTGAWDARNKVISRMSDPTNASDATTKHYVDTKLQELNQALRAYIAEVRSALEEAITALTERVSTNEQAIERLTSRMSAAEANITSIQQTLTQHASAISANTLGITANTSAIERLQEALATLQDTVNHLPTSGGGNVNVEALKQEIIDSLTVSVAKPTLVEVHYESYGGQWAQWNAQFSYNRDAVTVSGPTYAERAGTYSTTFTLKPLYKWNDGTKTPVTIQWVAEAQSGGGATVHIVSTTTSYGTEPFVIYNTAGFTFSGESTAAWNAPQQTLNFAVEGEYTELHAEVAGTVYNEGDTFNVSVLDNNTGTMVPVFNCTLGHDSLAIDCVGGANTTSPEIINVYADDNSANAMRIELTAENWSSAPAPKMQIEKLLVNGIEYPMVSNSPYSLSLDKTSSEWTTYPNQNIYFRVNEPYTALHLKSGNTGVVVDEGEVLTVSRDYAGEPVSRFMVALEHDHITIIGLGFNSNATDSFTVYADDDEVNGFVFNVTQTVNFPAMISTDETPSLTSGDAWSFTYSEDNHKYKYPRTSNLGVSNANLADLLANGSVVVGNVILAGDFCVYEKSASGDYTFTITPATGYEWTDHTTTAKTYTWTHSKTLDSVAAPTLTLASAYATHNNDGTTPLMCYGGDPVVINYATDSDGEISVRATDDANYPHGVEYEVDSVNKTISVWFSRQFQYSNPNYNETMPYSSMYVHGTNTLPNIYVKTLQSDNYLDSAERNFVLWPESGGYVEYSQTTTSDAAYANGTQMVTLPLTAHGCTVETETKRANAVGTHTLRATLDSGIEAWIDGSKERTREFEWTLHKECPLSLTAYKGFGSNTLQPVFGYNSAGVLTLSRGNVLSPAPTFSVYPATYAGLFEVTPIDNWGDVSQPKFKVVAKNEEAIDSRNGIYLKISFAEGEHTSAYTHYIFVGGGFSGKTTAGELSIPVTSVKLSTGVKTEQNGVYIRHGEIPSLANISVTIEDTSICEVEKVAMTQAADGVTTEYKIALKFTPKAIGNTNITVSVPETTHYRALTMTAQLMVYDN